MHLEVLANKDTFALEEVIHTEPLEYTDKYNPSKYGIIFKEKIMIGPEHVSSAFNIRLRKDGKDLEKLEDMKKLFKL
jgi:hypothetical protein